MDWFIQILIQFEQVLETWTGAWMVNYPTIHGREGLEQLGFVHNTSSPDSDADLEYNWKTCRKRKKYNIWSLIKFF